MLEQSDCPDLASTAQHWAADSLVMTTEPTTEPMKTDFVQMHRAGTFLLVNVHDAASAAMAEAAGAAALGTTSSGLAYSMGRVDGAGAVSRDEVLRSVEQICASTSLPVSVDAENGWAHDPEGVATTIRLLADAGAAGASIEDWSGDSAMGFYPTELAVDRVQAAIAAARSLLTPFVVNARAESYLYGAPNPYDHAIERLQRFAALGADCVYAPGPSDEATLARLVTEAGAPLNALFAVGGSLTMADAVRLGIRRVSVGGSLFRAMMGYFEATVARMVATGELDPAGPMVADERFDDLFG